MVVRRRARASSACETWPAATATLLASAIILAELPGTRGWGLNPQTVRLGAVDVLWTTTSMVRRCASCRGSGMDDVWFRPCRPGLRLQAVARGLSRRGYAQRERSHRARLMFRSGRGAQPDEATEETMQEFSDRLPAELPGPSLSDQSSMSRRQLMALGAAGVAAVVAAAAGATESADFTLDDKLVWSPKTEILNRANMAGGSAAPTKNKTYPVRFVTYLARFLLNYDVGSAKLWKAETRTIPLGYSSKEIEETRSSQFAQFSEAVEVGLLDYQEPAGVRALFSLMKSRYGTSLDRLCQLAILFSFMTKNQPVEQMAALLGEIDKGHLTTVVVVDEGGGYTGRVPKVTISSPQFGAEGARGTAVLKESGKILRIALKEGPCQYRYNGVPGVRISPPTESWGTQATAEAVVDKLGRLRDITITNRGSGYSSDSTLIGVEIFGTEEADQTDPEFAAREVTEITDGSCYAGPEAEVILDKEVSEILIESGGDGYATSIPLTVTIEGPAECGGEPDGQQAFAVGFVEAQRGFGVSGIPANNIPLPETSLTSKLTALLLPDVAESMAFLQDENGGRFQALLVEDILPAPSTVLLDPIFGPVGRSPLEKDRTLGAESYIRLAMSGAVCNALVRVTLHPVDCVKTRCQCDPRMNSGIIKASNTMLKEGIGQLYKGADVSTILGFLLGFIGFGANELFRRTITDFVGPSDAATYQVPIILLASGTATVVQCLLTCPWEAVRIRVMTATGGFKLGAFVPAGQALYADVGFLGLYSGLWTLLFRELPFAIAKFLVFELTRNTINTLVPAAQEGIFEQLIVSLLAGMTAGVVGAIVSNPADTILTLLNSRSEQKKKKRKKGPALLKGGPLGPAQEDGGSGEEADWREVVRDLISQPGGPANLFAGLGLRAIFFGAAIALQFFLYDYFKVIFKVAPDDLKLVLDVFADRLSFYDTAAASGSGL